VPRLYNIHGEEPIPDDAIYIGRGSPLGNPFVVGRDGTRSQCVAAFRCLLAEDKKLQAAAEATRGHDLVCFCYPKLCHGFPVLDYLYGAS